MAARLAGWCCATSFACRSPVGNATSTLETTPADDTYTKEATGLILMTRLQRVVRAHGSHHERRRHHRSEHGVGVLRDGPGAQQEGPEVDQIERAVGANAMADRVLHERVRADDEIA